MALALKKLASGMKDCSGGPVDLGKDSLLDLPMAVLSRDPHMVTLVGCGEEKGGTDSPLWCLFLEGH